MPTCVFCDHELDTPAARPAFDPRLGRLWRVCRRCGRWNVVPLEDRWERLESLERAVRDRGRSLLRTEHLDLVSADGVQLIRVGRAPRPELAGWRYGDVAPPPAAGLGERLRRLVLGLPTSPFGYGGGHGSLLAGTAELERRWFASPFLEDAPGLTAAFLHVPLAPECAGCGGPLALAPWRFQAVRLALDAAEPVALAVCGVCGVESMVPAWAARPALRLGLAIVNRRLKTREVVEPAAGEVDRSGGPDGLLRSVAAESVALGNLAPRDRVALGMALDEQVEAELLEREWQEAEELAAIVDGELTVVPGFEAFRRRVLEG